ncbi:pyridoxal kinase PdxY [Lentilitoribacter sp. EG35]|jgi:pyridoxine kinase|uniref:pyridoxal kinase PdxY n=1 Tax=Lentilitoribacter sp. EG35 TaxID=3234192 RepID=UPI0034605E65
MGLVKRNDKLSDLKKAVIVISSHVVRGSVGNRAAVFALEALGHQVWALQTVTLPWHPGHGPSTRIVPDAKQFDAVIEDLCNSPWLSEVGGIISGYLGDKDQAKSVAKLVHAVKCASPEALYLCDPVIGDLGGLYVPEHIALSIKSDLLPLADIITPNRFELSWLTGMDIQTNSDILSCIKTTDIQCVLATSAFSDKVEQTANLYFDGKNCFVAEHRSFAVPINGPGDLTSAILMSRLMGENDARTTLGLVTSSVYEILERTIHAGGNELILEQNISSLKTPNIPIKITKLPIGRI